MILNGFVTTLEQEGFAVKFRELDNNETLEIYHKQSKQTFIYNLNKNTGKIELYPKNYPEFLMTNIDNIK